MAVTHSVGESASSAKGFMATTLPYQFDTIGIWGTIIKGMVGLDAIVVAGIPYSLFVSHSIAAVILLSLVAIVLFRFTRVFFRNVSGSVGTVTTDAVVVRRGAVLGLPFPGPEGRFPLSRFRAVLVRELSGPIEPGVQGGPHARVYLAGKDGTPDILILRAPSPESGRAAGREMSALLNLPYEAKVGGY